MNETVRNTETIAASALGEQAVFDVFTTMLRGRPYEGVRKEVRDGVLESWTIRTVDEMGDRIDIIYTNQKDFPHGVTILPTIRQASYYAGEPCGIAAQFEYHHGNWILVE
jgi:hypothetical protein